MRMRTLLCPMLLALCVALSMPAQLAAAECTLRKPLPQASPELVRLVQVVVQQASVKLRRTVSEVPPGSFPWYVKPDGTWRYTGAAKWTPGFFPAALWRLYQLTCSPAWRDAAAAYTAPMMTPQLRADNSSHNVWYRTGLPASLGYELTGSPAYRQAADDIALRLAGRYDATVKAYKAADWLTTRQFPVNSDSNPSAEALYRAAASLQRPDLQDRARNHQITSVARLLRPDGGSWHFVDFDPATGAVLDRFTEQGLADGSTWARGEAWLLLAWGRGYAYSRGWAGNPRILAGFRKAAAFWMARVPADRVPWWDFDDPGTVRDSSAAAIAINGLIDMARHDPNRAEGRAYWSFALATLRSLTSAAYLQPATRRGILAHGTDHRPANRGVDTALIYGDYYLLEAVASLNAILSGTITTDLPLR
jgi:unsaturated chondroitin disaccharide hydrolase